MTYINADICKRMHSREGHVIMSEPEDTLDKESLFVMIRTQPLLFCRFCAWPSSYYCLSDTASFLIYDCSSNLIHPCPSGLLIGPRIHCHICFHAIALTDGCCSTGQSLKRKILQTTPSGEPKESADNANANANQNEAKGGNATSTGNQVPPHASYLSAPRT